MNPDIDLFEELSKLFSLIPLNGKRPIEENWPKWCEQTRPFDRNEYKGRNAGMPCGPANGILVIDVDDLEKFRKITEEKGWEWNTTRMHMTGADKPHLIYGYPDNGNHYGCRAFKQWGFDIRGIGGQVVAPGSIHPNTGKLYTVKYDEPIAPAPQWLLDLALQQDQDLSEGTIDIPIDPDVNLEALPLPLPIKTLIKQGIKKPDRSELSFSILQALLKAAVPEKTIFTIYERYPIGEKYREKGRARQKWLQDEIGRARKKQGPQDKCAIGMGYEDLEKEFSGETEWQWRQHIPKALPSMLSGPPGSGKTTFALKASKEVIETEPTGMVVWLATEGFVRDTFVKMKEMGIMDRRFQIPKKPDGTYRFNLRLREDCNYIANYLVQLDQPVLMVVVDSLRGATDFDANEDKMRIPIMNLNAIVCDSHKASCVWIHHDNKTRRENLLDTIAGSPAITAAVRQIFSVRRKSAYVRSIKQAKSNVGLSPELELIKAGNELIIRQADQETEEGQTDRAEAFLIELFKEKDTIPATEIFEEGAKQGITEHPLKDAKKRLGMQSIKLGENWFWKWKI